MIGLKRGRQNCVQNERMTDLSLPDQTGNFANRNFDDRDGLLRIERLLCHPLHRTPKRVRPVVNIAGFGFETSMKWDASLYTGELWVMSPRREGCGLIP